MKNLALVFLISMMTLSLTGCLQMFPPTVAEIKPGIYMLHAQSNAFGSRAALRDKLVKKAEEICNNKGFEEINNNQITNNHNAVNMGMVIPVSTKASVLTVKCKE
nr:hypothetical protein [Acinetobacter guillouiae]